MDAERLWPCPSSPAAAATISKVLDNDDLLGEILIRLVFPTSLVRAAAVCRRWLHLASDPAFLRRFRDLHPPRLLGFYAQTGRPRSSLRFVPTPHPPAELAAAIRRAGSILDDVSLGVTAVSDCQNGRLLVKLNNPKPGRGVLSPLHAAGDVVAVLPPLPFATRSGIGSWHTRGMTADGVVYAAVRRCYLLSQIVTRSFHELRDGTWHDLTSLNFPSRLVPAILFSRPFNGKIYLMVCASAIATFPSTLSILPNLSVISLPDSVECRPCRPLGNVKPWVDDSGLYLIHIKELQLHVWLHDMDSGQWLLQNTVCLREVYAQLGMADLVSGDGLSTATDIQIRDVGHSAEFVFLQVGADVLHIHMKSRNAEKVHTVKPEESGIRLVPFMMIWPPNFPVIKEDSTQNK